jgi:biopolymer transport protein ExbD
MAGGPQRTNGIIDTINVTPLVDIVLVLLVIFIVTAKIIAAPAVPVDLPTAAQTREVQVVFSVVIPTSGPTLVDGKHAADDTTLLRLAREAAARDPGVRAVINADGGVAHRRVIHVLGLLKEAGIARVAFGAVPEEIAR